MEYHRNRNGAGTEGMRTRSAEMSSGPPVDGGDDDTGAGIDINISRLHSEAVGFSEHSLQVTQQHRQVEVFNLSKGNLSLHSVNALQRDLSTNGSLSHVSITNMTITENKDQSKHIQLILASALYQQGNLSNIRSVDLSNCQLDDEIALQLASHMSQRKTRFESLNLLGNKVTDIGSAALAEAMKSQHCRLKELDLSSNRLTRVGVLAFCQHIASYQHLEVLQLKDAEQLLPVSVYQQFAAAIEKNHILQKLTLGSECMDGTVDPATNKAEKEMDALLRYFWQEPVYTAATDHIRNLLRLNCSGLETLLQADDANSDALRNMLNAVESKRRVDACYRILQLKPDLVVKLSAPAD